MSSTFERTRAFCRRFGLRVPILLGPMAGVNAPSLSIAVGNAGGLGACGALPMQPAEIVDWASEVRANSNGVFNLNLWIPDPTPIRDPAHEARLRQFLATWGPDVPPEAGDATPPEFATQCEALLAIEPPIVSSVMGLYPSEFVAKLKQRGIFWFAHVSTVREARAAEAAGADVIVAQGSEAGGHRGCFDATLAERQLVGSFALLPAVVDAVRVPVVATGGIADGRGVAAALVLGASAAQIGTAFCVVPKRRFTRRGQTHWGRRRPKIPSSAVSSAAVPTEAWRPITSWPPLRRMRLVQLHIPYSADSRRRCEAPGTRPVTFTGCRPGVANRPDWHDLNRPPNWFVSCGQRHRRCSREHPMSI